MTDLAVLRARNAVRWKAAKLTRASEFTPVAARLAALAAKARYQAIEAKTGVPWFFIAVAHQRESSQDWTRSLAQGDPWNRESTHVPAGRGPFKSFEDAAADALTNCAPFAARNKDWSVGGLLTMLEQYNGLGYFYGPVTKKDGVVVQRFPSQPSPYVWSGTDQYIKGKYIADGVFDANTVDKQLGCAGLILAMQAIDPSITFDGAAPKPVPVIPSPPIVPAKPSVSNPAPGSIGALIASILSAIFKRK